MTPAEYRQFVTAVCAGNDSETAARLIEARCHPPYRQRCIYCGENAYEPGWGCHGCGTASVEDVEAAARREATEALGDAG